MPDRFRPWLVAISLGLVSSGSLAQPPSTRSAGPDPVPQTAPVSNSIAATVNNQPIAEMAVQRGLRHVPPARQAEVRSQILNFLIDNALIDQYLIRISIPVTNKEIDAKLQEVKDAIQKQGTTFAKAMQELMLTEAELKVQIAAQLRWDKYVNQQATDKALRELFDHNRETFDGTLVRARHILLVPPSPDARAQEQTRARLTGLKKQIEDEVNGGLAKLPSATDSLAREQAREKLIDDAFGRLARKESACPSKKQDGDLGYFPRAGSMVEPFARAAFALKPYQMSDVVATQFGYHLILATGRKPGKDVKFEDMKEAVKEVYSDQLRARLAAQLRRSAKIQIKPPPK